MCPREGRSRPQVVKCGGPESFYCKAWGRETTGDAWWKPSSSWDLITVRKNHTDRPICSSISSRVKQITNGPCSRTPYCNPLNVTFTDSGKRSQEWVRGLSWGLRFCVSGEDPGLVMTLRLKIENPFPLPVGPNKVLPEQGPLAMVLPKGSHVPSKDLTFSPSPMSTLGDSFLVMPTTGPRLLNLIQGGFLCAKQL